MNRVTVKTSTIFIAKGGRTRVFHSVREVPPKLRQQLEQSVNSFNSATILIADRRGKEEILRALNGLPASLRGRLGMSLSAKGSLPAVGRLTRPSPSRPRQLARFFRKNWLEITLPLAVGLVVWVAFNYH